MSFVSVQLTDEHLLELSGNITDVNDLHKLGVKVLGLKLKQVNSVHTDSRSINSAASKLLEIWRRKQKSPHEAFILLCSKLRQVGWNQMAYELEHLGENISEGAGLTPQSKRKANELINICALDNMMCEQEMLLVCDLVIYVLFFRTEKAAGLDQAVTAREAICNSQRKDLDFVSNLHSFGKDLHQTQPGPERERN